MCFEIRRSPSTSSVTHRVSAVKMAPRRRCILVVAIAFALLPTHTVIGQELMPASPDAWTGFWPRAQSAPALRASEGGSGYSLEIFGNGVPNVYGGWRTRVQGLRGGQYYRFRARALPLEIGSPRESVTILLRWRGAFGAEVAPDYVWRYQMQSDESLLFDRTLLTPPGTTAVDVELVLQWAPNGRVTFDGLSFMPSAAPAPRPVKAAAVHYRPSGTSSGLESVQRAARYGEEVAAAHRPDVMVFGELLNVIGAPGSYDDKAEVVPGPSTDVMAGVARTYGVNVVFGMLERENGFLYNTAVFLDRGGNIAGKYRKVQLPLAEVSSGITPGNGVPVFETDIGRVALLICQDLAFPEPAREAAIQGAELLLVPIWGGKQATVAARAIEHSMYVVASGYDYPSEVVHPLGTVLDRVETLGAAGAAVASFDLSQRFPEDWSGDWRDASNKQRRTAPYTADPTTPPSAGDPPPPPPDGTAPVVSLTSPASGATVSGIVTVSATASDNVAVSVVRFSADGVTLADDGTAPYSAAWDSTATSDGVHTLTATAFDAAGNSASSSVTVNVANATAPPSGSTPFTGTPVSLPGAFEAENFDEGGQSVAYYDTTSGNSGGAYRSTDVDIEPSTDTGGGYNLSKTRAGEWLNYTVDVSTSGTYTFEARIANVGTGGKFRVEVDGADVTGPIDVPDTGGWQTWQTVTRTGIPLTAGQRRIRVVLSTAGTSGGVGNYNWFRFVASSTTPSSTPFGGTAVSLPGTMQAENFDEGGEGRAYHDTSAGNSGGAYRSTDVDLEQTTDTGGGYNVGWTRAGEWLQYTVNVASTGTYTFEARVANIGSGASFRLEVDGVDRTGPISVPDTGAWQSWQTISVAGIPLSAGSRLIRVVFTAVTSTRGAAGNFNWFRFVSSTSTASTTSLGGRPMALPEIVQAGSFDEVAETLACYEDTAADKEGGACPSRDVQVSGAADQRIGATSAHPIILDEYSAAGLAGWTDRLGGDGTRIVFTSSGRQTIRIQTRED